MIHLSLAYLTVPDGYYASLVAEYLVAFRPTPQTQEQGNVPLMERTDLEQWKAKEVARLLALVETERRYYQEMVAMLPVALVVLSVDRHISSANRAFRQTFGLRTSDLRGKTIDQILPSDRLIEKIRDTHVTGMPQT